MHSGVIKWGEYLSLFLKVNVVILELGTAKKCEGSSSNGNPVLDNIDVQRRELGTPLGASLATRKVLVLPWILVSTVGVDHTS